MGTEYDQALPVGAARMLILSIVIAVVALLTVGATVRIPIVVHCQASVMPVGDFSVLRAPRSGRLAELSVNEGDRVVPGQTLFRVATDELDTALPYIDDQIAAVAEAKDAARSLYEQQAKGLLTERNLVVTQVQVQTELLARLRRMRLTGVSSQDDLDHTRLGALDANISLSRTGNSARDAFATSRYEVAILEDRLAELQEKRAQTQAQIKNATVVASVAGYVHKLRLRIGQPVQASEIVTWIVPDGPIRVNLTVPSSGVGLVRAGQRARIMLSNYPRERYSVAAGRIERVWQQVDQVNSDGAAPAVIATTSVSAMPRDSAGRPQAVDPGMVGQAEIVLGDERLLVALARSQLAGTDSIAIR